MPPQLGGSSDVGKSEARPVGKASGPFLRRAGVDPFCGNHQQHRNNNTLLPSVQSTMEKQQNTAEAMLLHVRNTSAVSNSTLVEEPSSSAQPLQPPPATAPSPAVTLGSALQPPVVYGTLDQYAVGDVLGQGAFATVRVAVGLQTGRKVGAPRHFR